MGNISALIDFVFMGQLKYRKFSQIPKGEIWLNPEDFEKCFEIYEPDLLSNTESKVEGPSTN